MWKKERFEKPEMEQVMFEAEDVIVTSSCPLDGYCMSVCEPNCDSVQRQK